MFRIWNIIETGLVVTGLIICLVILLNGYQGF